MVRLHSETVEKDRQVSLQPLQVRVEKCDQESAEFDMIGVDAAIANSIRRTIHSDLSTLAIEMVYVSNNTSVIPDEVFSHRLGLVPLYYSGLLEAGHQPITLSNPIVLTLRVKNSSKQPVSVYASELTVRDAEFRDQVRIINPDILLCRLAANQELDLELHCIEGTGREHAKWSPVAVASYRLMPEIKITSPITGNDAVKFANCFTPGAVVVEDGKAVVKSPRLDIVSRECLRHAEFEGKVELGRVADHFIFNLEVVGQLSPRQVVDKSLEVLIGKCDSLLAAL